VVVNPVEVAAVSREAAVVANREAVVSLKKADVAAVLTNWKFTNWLEDLPEIPGESQMVEVQFKKYT
jgi:hypothetical protein